MKTPREYIQEIAINQPNIKHIAETGTINGSLLMELEIVFENFRTEVTKQEKLRSEAIQEARDDFREALSKVINSSWRNPECFGKTGEQLICRAVNIAEQALKADKQNG